MEVFCPGLNCSYSNRLIITMDVQLNELCDLLEELSTFLHRASN